MKSLEQRIKELPPELKREVGEYVETLIKRHARSGHKPPKFSWAGVLKDLRDTYTSVQLQHHILKVREDGE